MLHCRSSSEPGSTAKLWELRATASLVRLCRDGGRRTEARDLLAPVYDWFTEGFDIIGSGEDWWRYGQPERLRGG